MAKEVDGAARLAAFVKERGSQKEAAKALGVSSVFLSDVVRGLRPISKRLLDQLGLERVIVERKRVPA